MNDPEGKPADRRRSIDLNADLGEGFPNDVALLDVVSSASVCCGAHAGDHDAIRRTLQAAVERGVVVGAHPGYRDRAGFGRREQELSTNEVALLILDQVADLNHLGRDLGVRIRYLKPHGALYNQAQHQEAVARGVLEAVDQLGLPLVGRPGSLLEALARASGLRYIAEAFPDRRYRSDGSLTPRDEPGAMLSDPYDVAANGVIRTAAVLLVLGVVAGIVVHLLGRLLAPPPAAPDVRDRPLAV